MIHHHHAKDLSSTVVSQSFGQLSWTRGCNLAAKTFLKSSLNLNVEKHAKKFDITSMSRAYQDSPHTDEHDCRSIELLL
jgi:hypothetical protein